MNKYYIDGNPDDNGTHELHTADCGLFNRMIDKQVLGDFSSGPEALKQAKKKYGENIEPCPWCCNDCL